MYTTIPSRFGEGMFTVDSNIIDNAERPIKVSSVSCVIGNNNTDASGRRITADIAGVAKIFPGEARKENIVWLNKMPQWGLWKKKDIIHVAGQDGVHDMICIQGGALYSGDWSSSAKYQVNDYIKASDGNIYKAMIAGGQVQDPVGDNGKYWIKVASAEARFKKQ